MESSEEVRRLIEKVATLAQIIYNHDLQVTTVRLPRRMVEKLRGNGIPVSEATRALLYLLIKHPDKVARLLREVVESV